MSSPGQEKDGVWECWCEKNPCGLHAGEEEGEERIFDLNWKDFFSCF